MARPTQEKDIKFYDFSPERSECRVGKKTYGAVEHDGRDLGNPLVRH